MALQVYRAMWADVVEAGKTADYGSARLADHATSQAQYLMWQMLHSAHKEGVVIKGSLGLNPRVTRVQTNAVSIADCLDTTDWLNYYPDGHLQDDTPGGKYQTSATVGLLDGRWRVTRLDIGAQGSCP